MSKPSRQEAPRRRKKQYSLRVVKILGEVIFGAQRPPGAHKSPRAKKEPPKRAKRAAFAKSGANFKKVEKTCFQKIANRRDGSATTKEPEFEVIVTPTKRGHF